MIKSRSSKSPHYSGGKFNGNISDRSPNVALSRKSSGSNKFYGDFLTLTPRRSKMNDYLQYQQSHEPYDPLAGRKQQHYYQNNRHDDDREEHSYLNSLDTLKLNDEHNILHSKLFYQSQSANESSGNEYVISANNNQLKKHHVVTTNSNPNNIVSPPNQFNDNSINRFIKL